MSRVDVFADWQGWIPDVGDRERFVSRSRSRITYEEGGQLTGFGFGRRNNAVTARMYDKTEEIARKKHGEYWSEIWGARRDSARPVWRMEYEFGRTVLRQFGLNAPEEVLDGAADLWRYATDEWLSLREHREDLTKSRWPVAGEWAALRGADIGVEPIGLSRVRAVKRAGSLERAERQVFASLSSLGALHGLRRSVTLCWRSRALSRPAD